MEPETSKTKQAESTSPVQSAPAASENQKRPSAPEETVPDSTSVKRLKTHHTRKLSEEEEQPGKRTNVKSYGKLYKKEGQMVAYTGYDRRDDFRRFTMSAEVLLHYVDAFTDRGSIVVRQDRVLRYIRDNEDEMKCEYCPLTMYPVRSDGTHALPRIALAVAQLYRRSKCQKPVPFTNDDQQKARAAFEDLTGRNPPTVDATEVQLPNFGPLPNCGEDDLEAYNRCFNVLMYIYYSTYESIWPARFGSETWDEAVKITAADVPHWMQQHDRTNSALDQSSALSTEAPKSYMKIAVHWQHRSKASEAKALMIQLEKDGKDAGLILAAEIKILPETSAVEVRDLIRATFKMDALNAQIRTLQLRPSMMNMMKTEWGEVQRKLWYESGSGGLSKTAIWMTLRKLEEGEELWENNKTAGLSMTVQKD